jgi:hypothetical protein
MNTNLVHIVKQIIAEYGEAVLADPQRLKAFFSDLAKDEPKPLRIAFGRCVEAGAYAALNGAPDAAERAERKAAIAQRLRDEHGLDITLCAEAIDILEAAMPEKKETALQTGNTTDEQARGGGLLSEETGKLQKIIAEKNDLLIRCAQDIERLTEEKKQSEEKINNLLEHIAVKDEQFVRCNENIGRLTGEKHQIKKGRTAAVVLGIIAVAISIGVGVSKYNEMEGMYYSLLYDYNGLSRDYEKLSGDYEKSKAIWAINVTKLEVGNSMYSGNWITKPGESLTSAEMRYLKPVITVDSLTSGEITFFVKIINPQGGVFRNQKISPADYSYSFPVQVSRKNNQTIDLWNWGNSDESIYSAGEWTVEVWYNDVCLRSEKVRIN